MAPQRPEGPQPPRRFWPWVVLAAVVLGILLFAVWLWFEVQHVRRIKASTHGEFRVFSHELSVISVLSSPVSGNTDSLVRLLLTTDYQQLTTD
jgi:hypothetical protein